ncbi:MAG: DUF6391 domain-containing protein [Anaerolineae bacterium]|nr:DUF6391 domain-containing protein [Anaerolineae bacterium]
MSDPLTNLLNTPILSRIRRNHGLEHAAIHVLAKRFPGRAIAGHSDAGGFWLIGDLPTDQVESAVHIALTRLRAGERNLAIHPNCGTNFVTGGIAAGLAGAFAMFGAGRSSRERLERLPLAAVLATLALILARPLGYRAQQRITTSGVPGDLAIESIQPTARGRLQAHRIRTSG